MELLECFYWLWRISRSGEHMSWSKMLQMAFLKPPGRNTAVLNPNTAVLNPFQPLTAFTINSTYRDSPQLYSNLHMNWLFLYGSHWINIGVRVIKIASYKNHTAQSNQQSELYASCKYRATYYSPSIRRC